MLAFNLPHANARRLSSHHRQIMLLGVILFTTAWALRNSFRELDSGDYTYTLSLSKTTITREVIADFWMPVVLEDKATALAKTKVDTSKKTTVSVAASASTALDAHSQSSAPRKVHANHSHAAVTTTLSNTNVDAATTTTTEAKPIVPRLVPNNVGVDSSEIQNNRSNLLYPKESAAIISFIIPSTLRRATLNRTIESLQKQSRSNWEAIVGVDLAISNLTEKQVAPASLSFKQDRRVRYVPITSGSTDRGGWGNGAGEVRNQMIRNHATAKWVAFVDDDDTLSPDYIEHWETGCQHDQSADVIIFRMESKSKRILPPLDHGSTASVTNVGISYAVRKELFVRKKNGIAFVPHPGEDYNFLKQGQTCNATILITDCVTYFVRHKPPISRHQTSCRFENAIISDRPPRKKTAEKLG
jgi:hypothetical protein